MFMQLEVVLCQICENLIWALPKQISIKLTKVLLHKSWYRCIKLQNTAGIKSYIQLIGWWLPLLSCTAVSVERRSMHDDE